MRHVKVLQVLGPEEARLGPIQSSPHERRRSHPEDPAPGALRHGQHHSSLVSHAQDLY